LTYTFLFEGINIRNLLRIGVAISGLPNSLSGIQIVFSKKNRYFIFLSKPQAELLFWKKLRKISEFTLYRTQELQRIEQEKYEI